jgi:hypothetical protein
MLLHFLWSEVGDDTTVCGPFVGRFLGFSDEETSISAFLVTDSLKEMTNFVGKAAFPHNPCGFILDEMPVFQHLAGFLVDDGAEEMLSRQCGGVLFGGGKMVEGESIT